MFEFIIGQHLQAFVDYTTPEPPDNGWVYDTGNTPLFVLAGVAIVVWIVARADNKAQKKKDAESEQIMKKIEAESALRRKEKELQDWEKANIGLALDMDEAFERERKISRLKQAKQDGLLTNDEYTAKRRAVIDDN